MSQGSGNSNNILNLGVTSYSSQSITIPEANPQGYFTLYGGGNVGSAGFAPFYKNGVAYQVTAGKTCKVIAVIHSVNTAGGQWWQLCSATASFAQGAGSLTGGVYQSGATNKAGFITSTVGGERRTENFTYDFAASTYPGWQNTFSGSVYNAIALICKEV